jgi:hypothetical protein
MKRFANLLKKEIKELARPQLIISLAFTVILFQFIGQVSKKEVRKASGIQTISVLDEDGSAGSKDLLKRPEMALFKIVDLSGKTKEQALETAKAGESKLLLSSPRASALPSPSSSRASSRPTPSCAASLSSAPGARWSSRASSAPSTRPFRTIS